ncbi:MAG: hypothetical protein WC956_08450 [bacterium]
MKNALALLILLTAATSAYAAENCVEPPLGGFSVGEKVVADLDGPTFSEATVDGISGDYVSIKFPDGGTGNLRTKYVAHWPAAVPACFKVGDRVVAHAEKRIWKDARIAELSGENVVVVFFDGKRETKKLSEIVRFPTRY